tara:strand:- start:530 stop:985 length:456 start_codon:yes stop_codon:yes gene_type:complete
MKLPKQIKSERNIELFNLLPKSFISPIDVKEDIAHYTGQKIPIHLYKGLEYHLQPSFLQDRVQSELGEDALSLSYIATFVNKKVGSKWEFIKPLEYHTDVDISHTNGIGFRLVNEISSIDCNTYYTEEEYNHNQILRVVDALKEIDVKFEK